MPGKLEIRAYPSQNIHAKLYIMTFKEGDRDTGTPILSSMKRTVSEPKLQYPMRNWRKHVAEKELSW